MFPARHRFTLRLSGSASRILEATGSLAAACEVGAVQAPVGRIVWVLLLLLGTCAPAAAQGNLGRGEYFADSNPQRVEYDEGRGTLWLAPGTHARRVGHSIVVDRGKVLWGHASARALLTAGTRDVEVERGGLVGLDADGVVGVDVYFGRAYTTINGMPRYVPVGQRLLADEDGTLVTAEPLTLAYGLDVLDGFDASTPQYPSGFIGLLQVVVPGAVEPIALDPSSVALDVLIEGNIARVRADLSFDLTAHPGLPCCEPTLGVFQGLLPPGALLHNLQVELNGERHTAEVVDARSGTPQGGEPLMALPDSTAGAVQRLPIGLYPVQVGDDDVRVELEWTQPLLLSPQHVHLALPATGNAYGRRLASLRVTVRGVPQGAELETALAITPLHGAYVCDAVDFPLEPGISIGLRTAGSPRVWAGKSPAVDGTFFAIEEAWERVEAPNGLDVVLLLDSSGSTTSRAREHSRALADVLAVGLDPKRDRLAVVRVGERAEALLSLTAEPELQLPAADAAPGGITRLAAGFEAALALLDGRSEAPGRRVQIVYVGDGEATFEPDEALDRVMATLEQRGIAALMLSSGEGGGHGQRLTRWMPRWRASLSSPVVVTAAQARGLFGYLVADHGAPSAAQDDIDMLVSTQMPPFEGYTASVVAGRHHGARPLFDLPATIALCPPNDCAAPRAIDLSAGSATSLLGPWVAATWLAAAPGERHLDVLHADIEALRVYDAGSYLGLADLSAAFQFAYVTRRGRGAPETRWIAELSDQHAPRAGRALGRRETPELPEASSPDGGGSALFVLGFGRDPYLLTEPPEPKAAPSMEEVIAGQRIGGSTFMPGMNAVPGSMAYTVEVEVAPAVEYALTSARRAALAKLAPDAKKAEAFIIAWHEVSLGSTAQLVEVQNLYSEYGLYDRQGLLFNDIVAIDPYTYGTAQQQGAISYFIDQKYYARAEPILREARLKFPDDPFYHAELVKLLERTGRKEELALLEITDLRRSLTRRAADPGLEATVARLATSGQARSAREALTGWVRERGVSPTSCGLMARLEESAGKHREAVQLMRSCVESFPRSRSVRARLVQLLLDAGELEEAQRDMEQWRRDDPENASLALFLGDLQFQRGVLEDAARSYAQIVELAPRAALGFIKLGDVYAQQHQDVEATRAFEHALELEPSNLAGQLRMVSAAATVGDYDRALEALRTLSTPTNAYGGSEDVQVRNETYYQLLTRWHTEVTHMGDDDLAKKIEDQLMVTYVDGGMMGYAGQGTYAMRAAFVVSASSRGLNTGFSVTEPSGNVVSYITAYSSPLGAQLFSPSTIGGLPRVYWLPSVEPGTFTFQITHEGPRGQGPLQGSLYLHRRPAPFVEYWERYDVSLPTAGATQSFQVTVDGTPKGVEVAPKP